MIGRACLCVLFSAGAVPALDLALPEGAIQTIQERDTGEIALPVGVWDGNHVPSTDFRGLVTRTAWRLRGRGITPPQMRDLLAPQIAAAGWAIAFECADVACGGYDFRFASQTLPAPDMYVDLGNFRYLMAQDVNGAALALMISRGDDTAYLQVTEVVPKSSSTPDLVAATRSASIPQTRSSVLTQLLAEGRAPLDDLLFATGSSELDGGNFASLQAVSQYLTENAETTVAIVGHTDISGGLDPNVALSRRRAQSVRQLLIDRYGIGADRLDARGVGYLSPRRKNDTPEGRRANRRVEIVLTN